MAFLGPEWGGAAEAAECASDQNRFWDYHDLLFARQGQENSGAFAKDKLKGFAAELKLDTNAFNTCIDSGKYTQQVQQDNRAAAALGVDTTPTFLINGQSVIGALPFASFQQAIEAAKSQHN